MEADTDKIRAVGAELERLGNHWLAGPSLRVSVENDPGAFGHTPIGTELSIQMARYARSAQEAVRGVSTRLVSSGHALTTAADRFAYTEFAVGGKPMVRE